MTPSIIQCSWKEQKEKLKLRFAALTDNDFLFETGNKEEMLGRLQLKLGKSKEQLHKIIETL